MLYRPDVCNCTMQNVPPTVPAYAIPDLAYTAEVLALTQVEIDVNHKTRFVWMILNLSHSGGFSISSRGVIF